MKKVDRCEILDLGAYEQVRPRFLQRIIELKKNRRISVGPHMTFVFENRDTVLFQIQEMLRTERISTESAIAHEIETYNSMVPDDHELFATVLIEVTHKVERARILDELHDLKEHVFLRIGERRIAGEFETLPGEEEGRLPAVNYVRFRVGEEAARAMAEAQEPAAVTVTHPRYREETPLTPPMRAALVRDLEDR